MCHLKIFLLSFKVIDVEVFAFSECFLFSLIFFTIPHRFRSLSIYLFTYQGLLLMKFLSIYVGRAKDYHYSLKIVRRLF